MSRSRRFDLVKYYMETIRQASGNDEFLDLLVDRLNDDAPLHALSQMTIGELHELFGDWITEHDE